MAIFVPMLKQTDQLRSATRADTDQIARVYVDTWRASYKDILPAQFLAQMDVERQAKGWRREVGSKNDVIVVARGDTVAGFCSGGRERDHDPFFRGEIFTLYVDPRQQRQGSGSRLLREMLRRLQGPVLIWVLEQNHDARAFYHALGGVPVRRRSEKVGGEPMGQIAYAYFDVG